MTINTHNRIVNFGKHKGQRWTRLPVSYLKWLINEGTQYTEIAKAELKRRGTLLNYDIEISGHAIDRASTSCLKIWEHTRKKDEGLHTWLVRISKAAIKQSGKQEKINFKHMRFVFCYGEVYPTLKTIMPKK
jgi:uncharacterized protein (DUF3820 family)